MRRAAVVTGTTQDEQAEETETSPFASLTKPVIVFVADASAPAESYDKLDEVVFKNEKVGLAMKAFRAVRMSPEQADEDLLLGGHGKTVPRLLVVDPVKERIQVLEDKKIKVSTLYKAMKSAAGRYWKEKLDSVVKDHIKLLNERDKLVNEEKVLREKEGRLAEDDSPKALKDLAEVREALGDLGREMEKLNVKERDLWNLTPKDAPA